MTTVSFPGLGIGEFTMDKVALAFSLFGLDIEIRWYGILITLGIILAIIYAAYRAKFERISVDDLLDIGILSIIAGVVGARTYYVLTYGIGNFIDTTSETAWQRFSNSFVNIIAVWNGGIAIYGAIIGGALAVYLVCRYKKINYRKAFDAIAPGVMIGQIIGRWGNFVNGEAHGVVVSENSFLYFMRMGLLPNENSYTKMYYFHPTFLYESLWNLIGFIIINALYKKKKFDGQIILMYLAWYGFGRMFVEGLRTDSLYIGVFRISQVVGFCCFIIGTALIFMGLTKAKKTALENADYVPVYPKFTKKSATTLDFSGQTAQKVGDTDKAETENAVTQATVDGEKSDYEDTGRDENSLQNEKAVNAKNTEEDRGDKDNGSKNN